MRGYDRPQTTMLTLVNPEQRVPFNHPIRLIKALAEVALKELSPLLEQMYSEVGRPSIPPERLLEASVYNVAIAACGLRRSRKEPLMRTCIMASHSWRTADGLFRHPLGFELRFDR